jgi:hypothetical protein
LFVKRPQIVEAVLPGLVLLIFLAILPIILSIICRLSGFVSLSQVDFGVLLRYYWFQASLEADCLAVDGRQG